MKPRKTTKDKRIEAERAEAERNDPNFPFEARKQCAALIRQGKRYAYITHSSNEWSKLEEVRA